MPSERQPEASAGTPEEMRFQTKTPRGAPLAASLVALVLAASGAAEVTLDDSFGNDFESVPLNADREYHITDDLGQYSNGNSNLFFSLWALTVEPDNAAIFGGTAENTIVRVTGDSRSFFFGSTSAAANLFLLNPNGIEVRDGASFDVGGSLHLSTADVLRFGEGEPDYGQQLLPPDRPGLLSAEEPYAFGFTRSELKPISLAGPRLLGVPEGEVLSIIGGDPGDESHEIGVSVIGNLGQSAQVNVGNGTLQIAAAKAPIDIPVRLEDLDMDALGEEQLGEVVVEQLARLEAGRQSSGQDSGKIVIRAERFVLTGGAKLNAVHDTTAAPAAPNASPDWGIDVAASEGIEISGGAAITSLASRGGRAGDVRLDAPSVRVSGGAELRTFVSDGIGGDVLIDAETAVIDSGARLWSRTQGTGGGDLVVDAANVEIRDAGTELLSQASGGTGGSIRIDADDRVVIEAGARLVSLTTGSLDGSAERGGDIRLDAAVVKIRDAGTELLSQSNVGTGGDIRIDADDRAVIEAGAKLLSRNTSTRRGGDIGVLAAERVEIRGAGSELLSEASAGAAGRILLDAPTIVLSRDAAVTSLSTDAAERGGDIWLGVIDSPAQTVRVRNRARVGSVHSAAAGSGGNIEVAAANVELSGGGQIFAETTGAGDSGSVMVHDADRVRVVGSDDLLNTTAIGTVAGEQATGGGGLLSIDTRILEVLDRGEIQTRTLGAGAAGNTRINASERVTVRGGENGFAVVSTGSNTPEDAIVAGRGGNLTIETSLLELRDGGQVTTSVQGPGSAGLLEVFADRIEISGTAGTNESGLFSQSISQSLAPPPEGAEMGDRGRGGNIFVEARDKLRLAAGGRISAETSGPGDGGNIEIHAGREIYLSSSEISALSRGDGAAGEVRIIAGKKLTLVGGSRLTTEAKQASGGKITVEAGQLVYLVDSQITTEVFLGSDNGGDILIDPDFVVLDGASVIASADSGDGGAITIIAGHLFPSADTEIEASSRRGGIDGTIVVEPPETEVIGQLTTLETSLVDASSLLTTPCAARTAPSGSFVVSSRTSLAASPDSPLSWLGVAGLDGLTPAGPECRAQATQ